MSVCSVKDCNRKRSSKGYCAKHYARFHKWGDAYISKTAGWKNYIDGKPKSKHELYHIWAGIRQRCNDKNCHAYKHYGARGIKVCERWDSFANFVADMGERPVGSSIDRIDVNGNYEPSNCRWATKHQQMSNKTNSGEITGVHRFQNGWRAVFQTGYIRKQKVFADRNLAIKQRKVWEKEYVS